MEFLIWVVMINVEDRIGLDSLYPVFWRKSKSGFGLVKCEGFSGFPGRQQMSPWVRISEEGSSSGRIRLWTVPKSLGLDEIS